jgi:Pentapeptide repeats (8 copies)
MRITKIARMPRVALLLTVAVIIGATTGITLTVAAGAQGSSTTYYGCVSAKGSLSKVGATAPACPGQSTQISWNSVGPQGAAGPQGPAGSTGPQGPAGATVNSCSSPPGADLNFSVCNLTSVAWPYVDLAGSLLIDTNLTKANLSEAIATGANLTNADLSRAKLPNADLTGANMTNANLAGATLVVVAPGANLTGANLSYDNVSGNLTGANLTGANLTGDLIDADLYDANMAGANVTDVNWGAETTCPDGTSSESDGGTCNYHL